MTADERFVSGYVTGPGPELSWGRYKEHGYSYRVKAHRAWLSDSTGSCRWHWAWLLSHFSRPGWHSRLLPGGYTGLIYPGMQTCFKAGVEWVIQFAKKSA